MRGCHRRPYVAGEMCITHAKREADRLFSLWIRARDGRCQRCGTTRDLDCSHHITRERLAVRYSPDNACAHCRGCHVFLTHHGALHVEWIIGHIGAEAYDDLMDRAYGSRDENGVRHQTESNRPDYGAVIALYRAREAA